MDTAEIQSLLPLTPKAFHILTALAEEPQNGYRLGRTVEERSGGAIRMSPGTLYENVHRLATRGLIGEVEQGYSANCDGRGQRFYELTPFGLTVLRAEMDRIAQDLKLARSIPALSE